MKRQSYAALRAADFRKATGSSPWRGLFIALAPAFIACEGDFEPVSEIQGVRILATRADKPYAKPGDVVAVEMLAADGRLDQTRPMSLSWLPAPCVNPKNDAYYECYDAFATAFPEGVDLTSSLVSGPTLSIRVPDDILEGHTSTQSGTAFGTVVVFSMACAGQVRYVGRRSSSLQATVRVLRRSGAGARGERLRFCLQSHLRLRGPYERESRHRGPRLCQRARRPLSGNHARAMHGSYGLAH